MILTRRSFLKTCLALAAAPAVVRAESLMKLCVPPQELIAPPQELASAEFMAMAMQLESSYGGRYTASMMFNAGNGWMRREVSGLVDGPPTVSIDAKGELELVGARECVMATAPLGKRFNPKDMGLVGGLILTGDAKYVAEGRDVYASLNGVVGQYGDTPKPSRLGLNLISNFQEEPARTNVLAGTAALQSPFPRELKRKSAV